MMNKMRKMKNKKGFTLMEMLIVVAIIAILIAIAIPTFASSLNKARVATDEANIRAGYASVMADVLMNENDKTATPL
ncbi:prepilin-type N-terminal cleavage/methylation domain-containing protein [Hominenteromicrobium sp.]|uniref:prepilin-type N-terminal cleavage/methylation domain-containing protein n=1 Tax=Hominenteromicrobium sp. TaxID=3073581 RepID=UPI003A925FA3